MVSRADRLDDAPPAYSEYQYPNVETFSARAEAQPYAEVNRLYAEVDNGRLFIAKDRYFQGRSINSYNNWFTQFFANLFGLTFKISLNSQEYVVNKKSYDKFLNANGFAPIQARNADMFRNINLLPLSNTLSGTMRQALNNASKVQRLTAQLFEAITRGDAETAKDLIGRGADIDYKAWRREDKGTFLFNEKIGDALPLRSYAFRAIQFTPLLLSAQKGCKAIFDHLIHFGANSFAAGETCIFTRQLTNSNSQTNFQTVTRFENQVVYDRDGRPQNQLQMKPGLDLVSNRTDQYMDHYTDRKELILTADGGVIQGRELPNMTGSHTTTYTTGRLGLI